MKTKRRAYEDTTVSANQSKAEIRDLLIRYGAEQFGIAEQAGGAVVGFVAHGRMIRLEIPLPDRSQPAASKAGKVSRAGTAAAFSIHDQEERRIWRAARAWIFAQMEAVESGIRTFEEAFFSDTVIPGGQTVWHWYKEQMEAITATGEPPQLPGLDRAYPAREQR